MALAQDGNLKAVVKQAKRRAKLKLPLCVRTWGRTTKLNTSLGWRNNLSNTLPKHKHMLGQKGPARLHLRLEAVASDWDLEAQIEGWRLRLKPVGSD